MVKHAYLPPKIWQHPYRDIIKLSVQPYAEHFRRTNVHAGFRAIREDTERDRWPCLHHRVLPGSLQTKTGIKWLLLYSSLKIYGLDTLETMLI